MLFNYDIRCFLISTQPIIIYSFILKGDYIMTANELLIKINNKTGLNAKLWEKADLHRIYFNLKSKVDSFLEIDIENNEVISVTSKCKYTGKPVSQKWFNNYTEEEREYMDEVSKYANRCIRRQKGNSRRQ